MKFTIVISILDIELGNGIGVQTELLVIQMHSSLKWFYNICSIYFFIAISNCIYDMIDTEIFSVSFIYYITLF